MHIPTCACSMPAQDFTLSLERREEVRQIIGQRAEFIAWVNCVMDRSSLDAAVLDQNQCRACTLSIRPGLDPSPTVSLTAGQLQDLITVHLADWLEQVERQASKAEERHQWKHGEAWGYRRRAFQKMADLLGGAMQQLHTDTFAREPEWSRSICQDLTPPIPAAQPAPTS